MKVECGDMEGRRMAMEVLNAQRRDKPLSLPKQSLLGGGPRGGLEAAWSWLVFRSSR